MSHPAPIKMHPSGWQCQLTFWGLSKAEESSLQDALRPSCLSSAASPLAHTCSLPLCTGGTHMPPVQGLQANHCLSVGELRDLI